MAAGVHIQEPVLDTLRREDEIEKLMDQASNITLVKIAVEECIGASHTRIEPPDTLETDFEVKDSAKGNEGGASTLEGEMFLKSPSDAEVYFGKNNLAPDACQVSENAGKMAAEHETDASHVGEAKLDAEESNGLEKGLVSALEVAAAREVGHGESIPVHEAGLPEIKEDRESTIPEEETRGTVHDTETTSSVEEKGMTSTSQGENIEQTTFDTNQETGENTSTIVADEETEQNLSIEVDDSQMKTDEKLEDEKSGSTVIPEGQIKDEESTQNELFETKNETETVVQKCDEDVEKGVESLPVVASDAEDIKASTSDHDAETSAQNPLEIEVDKSECKPEKETPEEQVEDVSTVLSMTGEDDSLTKDEAHLEKQSEKPCFTDASTRDVSHDEMTPVDKAKTMDGELSKSDSFEDKEDTESTILVEEPIIEKHLESLSSVPDDIQSCDLVQDTEAKSSIKEKLPTATPQEIWGHKLEQTALDTNEETPEDISANISNEETEQNSIVEVPFVGEALTTDNELAITTEKIKDDDQREKNFIEHNNGTESGLLKQEVTEEPVGSLQLAKEAEDTLTENPQETEVEKSDCKSEKETLEEQVEDVSTLSSMTGEDDSLTKDEAHWEKKSEKPCLTDGGTAPVDKATTEDEDPSKSDLFEDKEDTESTILVEEPIMEKHLESLNAASDDIKACDLVQDTETKSSTKEKLPTATQQEIWGVKIEQTSIDTKEENPEDISTTVSNEETEQNSIVEMPFVAEALTTENELAITEGKIKVEDQREKDLLEDNNDTESELPKQEGAEKPIESLQLANEAEGTKVFTSDHDTEISALENQVPSENAQEIVADETESKRCDVFDTNEATFDVQDVSTIESNNDNEENSVIEADEREKPLLREEATRDAAGDESTYTHEDKDEGGHQRRAESFENPNSAESMSLIEDDTILKHVKSRQLDAEDIKTHVLDQVAEPTGLILASEGKSNDGESAVKYEVKTEDDDHKEDQLSDNEKNPESNVPLEAAQIEMPIESFQETLPSTVPQGFLDDETEEKTVDAIQKEEIPDVQHDVSTTVLNDDHEETSVIEEDDSQMKNEENLGEEIKKPSSIEASRTDASGDESTNKCEDKSEGEEQMRAASFEDKEDTESTLLKEGETAVQPLESLQVDVEDIKTYVSDRCTETTGLVEVFEGVANDDEPEGERNEYEDQKKVELCDTENIPDSALLLEAAHTEKPFESSKEVLLTLVPQGFPVENKEENATTTVSKKNIEDDSLLQVDGSQIQCKGYSEEESEITSTIKASTKNNDDNSVNAHEDSSAHEVLSKHEFGDKKFTSQEEEQVETSATSSNIASKDIVASDSCQETETTSSQEERTLNEEETVCEQIEVETLDTTYTKMQTSKAQDVSTIAPNGDSGENSVPEKNDLQVKNEETFGKETEKPSVTEASTTDALGDDSASKCADRVEGEGQTGAELFEGEQDVESKMLKEEDIMVRLVESPQVDTEDIKTYVSDEGAETTGIVEASQGDADNDESAVKNEVKTEDIDKKEDELSVDGKNAESGELLEAAQTEKPIESLKETLLSTVPRGFLDDNTEEKKNEAVQKDEDVQNVTTTVPSEKIEENSLIEMDGSQIQHEEYLEKEHEISSVIEALTKHADDDELTVHEDNIGNEDPKKIEFEIEKDAEINLQEDDARIETLIKSLRVAAEDIIASDTYQGTETTYSHEEGILNGNEIVHEEKEVERRDAADTKKETPEALNVSTFASNDDNEENLVIGENDAEMENEENLGKESKIPSSIEALPMDASGGESIQKCEDKDEGEEHMKDEDTECTLLKEVETAAQPLDSPQVDVEDIKTYVTDQGKETTGLVEVFEEAANDNQPEVKCTIKTEDEDQREDELCDSEKIPNSNLLLEVAEMEKPFESLKEALPTSVPRGFLDEKTEEKIIDATDKSEDSLEIQQNVTTIVSNENIQDDSLTQVHGLQMQCKEFSEEESEKTPIAEAATKNVDDDFINVHEDSTELDDLRKDELVETKEDTKIIPQKEEAQVETAVKSLQIAAEDIIESDSCQETETMSSQEDQILNEEEIVHEQIEVETLDTTDIKTKSPEDVSTTALIDDSEANPETGENALQMRNKENSGNESIKPSVIEASNMDASGDESTNKREDKVKGEEQKGAEMFVDRKDTESTLLKEEEISVKLVDSPHVDTENIKTYFSNEGAEITGMVEAFEGDADDDKSAVEYEVKTEDNDQKEDKLFDNEKSPESGVFLEATQLEKPTESLQETLPSTVPREFLDDKTEEKTMDAIEKDMGILDIQNIAKTVSNEKIENSLIQADGSQIQHEEYLEKEIEISSMTEASTKLADDEELRSIHEVKIEHKDLRTVKLLEKNKGSEINLQEDGVQIETPVNSLQVAAEDIIASDSYHETETTSQDETLLNENEIVCEQTEVERLDTSDSDKENPVAQNFATLPSSENIKENSLISEDGSELKHDGLFEKESKAPPSSETLEANDEVPEIIHQDKIEDEKLEKVDEFERDKPVETTFPEEITLLNEEAQEEKLNESSQEDLEEIKDIVSRANTTERSLIEVQSLNENRREIVGNHMEENIVDKNSEETEDENLVKDVILKNETHTEIGFLEEEEPVRELQEPEKKDLEIKALVYESTEPTSSIEERDLTEISQESVVYQSEDNIVAKAQEISDFTSIVSDEHVEKNSPILLDEQMKHEELYEKECEMLSTAKTSFLNSSSSEPTTIDLEDTENGHLNKVMFEDEKHTKIAIINDQAPVEEPLLEEVKAFVSLEGAEKSSMEEQDLTEISPEIVGDQLEEKILDKVGMTRELTKFGSDENGEDISLTLVDESQIKREELLERETEASPLSKTSLQSSKFNQEKTEDEVLNRGDKFESEKHADISLIKEEAPLENLNESSLRKDLEEIKAFDLCEDTGTSSTGEKNLTAIPQENDFTTVDASQIENEELLERESETPPLPLLPSSDGKLAVVYTDTIEHKLLEEADMCERKEYGEATSLNEEALTEKLTESSKDLECIKESITGDGTKISTEEQNLTISQEIVDDQVVVKVLDVAGEASDSAAITPDNNTERNLLVEVDASQMKHAEHLEKESEIPFLLNTSSEEPTTVQENKVMVHAEIILSNEEAIESSSKEENEDIRPSVLCEDTERSSIEQERLIANSHEIVGDQLEEKIIDMAQNGPDLTRSTSDENAENNSLTHLDGSQIKHEEPLEKESETSSMSLLDTKPEESTILQGRIIDDQDLREVDKFEHEKDTGATVLKEPTPAENVTEVVKDDSEDAKVFLSCEDEEITSSREERRQKENQQEIVVEQTQENIFDSDTKAQDFKRTVSHENTGEDSLIQVDESQVKHEIVSDQTQENVLDTAPKDQDFKPAISRGNAEENSLAQVDEIRTKHDELEKEIETPPLLIQDTSNEDSRIIYADITEDGNLQKINDFMCEKHEEITSTEEETRVTNVNESSKEDLEDIKAVVSVEDSETISFEEKQSLKENPQEILIDQQEEKILDIAPEAQNFMEVVSFENVEKDSMIQEDESQTVHEEISEKGSGAPSLSIALILNTTSEDSIVIHENKIENEDTRDVFECEKHADGKLLDAAREAPESKIIVLDENSEEKSFNQVDKSQTKHEELPENESKTLSLSETSSLNTSNEDSTTINDDKSEDEDPEKVDKLECEKHTELLLTKEEEPVPKLNDPLKEDIKEIKAIGSCLDTKTSSTEDQSLQINPQEDMGDQTEENIIDTTPEPQKFTALVSDESTKENLSPDVDESQIKHELFENESEKPALSILKTINEESSFICDSKTENEDVERDEKVEQINDFPKEGPENLKISVPSENLEATSPIEEQSITENSQENLTKDKIPDVVPEALELKTVVSDKNIAENPFILEDGSQMKHEEHSEKESEKPSWTETSIQNTRNEEPTLILDDKIVDEDQTQVNKSECEKHAEITELQVENPNPSNLENFEAFVSCEDIEPKNATEDQSLTVNPIENVNGEKVGKVLDNALEAPGFAPNVPDDNDDANPSIQVDGSQMKHEKPLEKESEVPSLLETSLLNTNSEELETIHNDKISDEALKNVDEFDEFESKKCSEVNKLKEEVQVEESMAYKDVKAYVSYQDTEASALQEQILTANPQDISEDNFIDASDLKEKNKDNFPVSNVNVVKDSLIQTDESEIKHEEILEKEPYLAETSTVEANEEPTTIHKDMIEEESGKIVESTLLNEGSPAYESVDSLQVVSEDIKASVSCRKTDTECSNLNVDPQKIAGDQTDDKSNTSGTREITLEALTLTTPVSNENEVLDSSTPQDGLEIEHEEISMLADNKESIIIHEDTIEGEDLKNVDTFKSVRQTENTFSKKEAPDNESMDSLEVASELIKASVSCQDRDPTSSSEEQILTTTPPIVGDHVEEKVKDTAKSLEETPDVWVSSSILEFQEDEANRIVTDDIKSVMVKVEETLNRDTASAEISSFEKVQDKEEEKEIISKTKIDERAVEDDTRVKLPEEETDKTYIEVKEIDFSSHAENTSEITQHDGAKDISKGNENSTAKNEFLKDERSNANAEPTIPIVNADVGQLDKDIKAETVITETGAAYSALPITGVQCGQVENESEDSKAKETETSLATEGREYQGQHTKLHESPSSPLSHVKDSEWEMARKRGTENPQSGDDKNDDMKELNEGSTVVSNERNIPEANLNENIEAEVTARETVQQDSVSEFVVQETQEQPARTDEAVPEEKGIKNEQGETKYDDSDDLKINSSTMATDKIAPSDILCSSTSDAGQKAVGQETQIVVDEKEQKPGKGKAVEAVPEEKGIDTEEDEIRIDTEEDEIKEHDFNVLKENSRSVALYKTTPDNILQGSTTDAALRATSEETPEQHGLDEASLKEIEGGPASITDKLTVLKADQIDNANFDSLLGSNKNPVLQHGDSSESSQTEGEKQNTSEPENRENCGNEETAKPMKTSESIEMDKPSLLELLQEPVKEVSKVLDHLIDKKQPISQEEELQAEKLAKVEHEETKTDEEKDGEGESGEHQISDLSSDPPVMVDAADKDVKVAHKKSHNILSGVGSKVKHSISKVKKAITGKSSHPKSSSPKYTEKI